MPLRLLSVVLNHLLAGVVSLDPWSMRGLCLVSLSLPKILRKEAVRAVNGA